MKKIHLLKLGNFLILSHLTILLFSQDQNTIPKVDYTTSKVYEIGGINVVGAVVSDASAIKSIAGLKIGDQVKVPGVTISNALKALWRLGIFSDVQIFQEKTIGDIIFLEIQITESSRLKGIRFTGVKKSKLDQVRALVTPHLQTGRILTASKKSTALNAIKSYYLEQGYADVAIDIQELKKEKEGNNIQLIFKIDKKEKVQIAHIEFLGIKQVASKKLKKVFKLKTKGKLFAKSKLVEEEFTQGKKAIIEFYNTHGYLDATIKRDSVWRDAQGDWQLLIDIREGNIYYFGNIVWIGNATYSTKQLATILNIQKGDIFDQSKLDRQLNFNAEGNDIRSLYMDNGYLFFNAEAIQTAIRKDTIDLKIRIGEGPEATVDKVTIKGNDRTHEHVIRREIRSQPGKKFSRADIIRSQRQIINLGYFQPESLDINTSVNSKRGTVDIEYTVEEKNSDQFELSGGWGGSNIGLTGTVGVSFNNLSLRKLLKPKTWTPLPMGDGQHASIRLQSNGRAYQSLNFSFTEPWLGGKRRNALTTSLSYSRYTNGLTDTNTSSFKIFGSNISLGKQLTFPDDNFISTTTLGYQKYALKNWSRGLFTTNSGRIINNGTFHNLSLTQTIARSSINHPIFPTGGSKFSLSLQFTPPYSLFNKKDYSMVDETDRFKLLEYHKWRFDAEWYTPLVGKLTLKVSAKMGFLGSYNSDIGTSPFERFQLGGDGLSNTSSGFTGTDILSLRGYEVEDLANNFENGSVIATPIYNKFTMEFRYPLSMNPNASIYGLAFLEAGNAYQSFKTYNPFDLQRSVGIGFRAFLPMFGTIGVDYGLGFDKAGERNFGNFGKLSFILGFEPE